MNGVIVCYMMESTHDGSCTDHYQPFIEYNEDGQSPREQAQKFYNEIVGGSLGSEDSVLFSANMCDIIFSTEGHYTNIIEPSKKMYLLLKCSELTGDSTVEFFPDSNTMSKAFFKEVQPLLDICFLQGLEEDGDEYSLSELDGITTARFNTGHNDKLDKALPFGDVNTCYQMMSIDVPLTATHYIVKFSSWVDECLIKFHTKDIAQREYQDWITSNDIDRDDHGEEFSENADRTSFYYDNDDFSITVTMEEIPNKTTGNKAKEIFNTLLAAEKNGKYPEPYIKGYFKAGRKWIGFDNTTGELWQEEFTNSAAAILWLDISIPRG